MEKQKVTKHRTSGKKAAAAVPGGAALSSEARVRYIGEAAYFIAQHEGFPPGRALDHWLRAEAEVDKVIAGPQAR